LLKRSGARYYVSLNQKELETINKVLDDFVLQQGIQYHELRTRYSGSQRFISVHILVPGYWTVQKGHDLLELIERELSKQFDRIDIDTHLEPVEDSASWQH